MKVPRKTYVHQFVCEFCNGEFTRITINKKEQRRFCSKSHSNAWQHKQGLRRTYCVDKTIEEWRDLKRTDEEILARKHALQEKEKAKQLGSQQKSVHHWKGKSLEERLGNDRASEVRKQAGKASRGKKRNETTKQKMRNSMHRRMQTKPETVVSNGIKGWYKGFFFRSSYEYFFLKKIESEHFSIKDDVKLENFQIPYNWKGKIRTYIPDIFIPKQNIVYEVKNSHSLNEPQVCAKAEAATIFLAKQGISYKLVSEKDFEVPKSRLIRKTLEADPCVFLLSKSTDDKFTQMFKEQKKFMELLCEKRNFSAFPVDLSTKEGQKNVKEITHDCMHELFEAIHLLTDSKNHRKTLVGGFSREKFLEELSDALHYLIEIFIISGITSEEIFRAYMKKGTVNFARILENY